MTNRVSVFQTVLHKPANKLEWGLDEVVATDAWFVFQSMIASMSAINERDTVAEGAFAEGDDD